MVDILRDWGNVWVTGNSLSMCIYVGNCVGDTDDDGDIERLLYIQEVRWRSHVQLR